MEQKKFDLKNKASHYILTYHCDESHPWEDTLRTAFNSGGYRCIAGQLERGKKSNQVHIQAYIGCEAQLRGTQVIKHFPPGSWFKKPNRWQTDRANIGPRMYDYCTKADTRISESFLVLGEPPKRVDQSDNGKRGREEQKKQYSTCLELAKRGDWTTIQSEFPDFFIKHYTTLKKICVEEKVTEEYPFPHPFRAWQIRCMELLDKPDDRTIHWFYDQPGASGKSTFLKWLATKPTAFYLDGGKKQDNIFLLKQHHTLLLVDLPRHSREFVPYSTMETFKNGIWTSTKYEGNRVHRSLPGSVVVVANFLPDVTKLSMDRWDIYEIDNKFNCIDIKATDLLPEIDIVYR